MRMAAIRACVVQLEIVQLQDDKICSKVSNANRKILKLCTSVSFSIMYEHYNLLHDNAIKHNAQMTNNQVCLYLTVDIVFAITRIMLKLYTINSINNINKRKDKFSFTF